MISPIRPVLLAGGAGTRLWPASRQLFPKQLLALTGADSLLQATRARVTDGARFLPPLTICGAEHRFIVAEQLRSASPDGTPGEILVEPVGRNTAAAACLAALRAAETDPQTLLLLLPADHAIADLDAFQAAVATAAGAAAAGWLTTFGMAPSHPETGYGYIKQGADLPDAPGAARVDRFVEKPPRADAETMLAEGGYLWNSGMFLLRAADLLDELAARQPAVLDACRAALSAAACGPDFIHVDTTAFAACPAISLDHGVMEATDRAAVVPADLGWSDVGSWRALWEVREKDARGNVVDGDVVARDSSGCFLHAEGRLLTAVGLRDLVVVDTDDALLVCPRARAGEVGALVADLYRQGRPEVEAHSEVVRPWGRFRGLHRDAGFQVKRITVVPGGKLSLQRHRHRAEHWVVVAGEAEVTLDDAVFRLGVNEATHIPLGAVHRLYNPGDVPVELIEVQLGDYLGEDDIERLEDSYGRG